MLTRSSNNGSQLDLERLVDPVCGLRFYAPGSAAEVWHDMRVHHFCSTHCRDAFVSDPDRFWPPPATNARRNLTMNEAAR